MIKKIDIRFYGRFIYSSARESSINLLLANVNSGRSFSNMELNNIIIRYILILQYRNVIREVFVIKTNKTNFIDK